VFTDLANYTAKVARSDREGLRRILQEHEDLVSPVVQRHGGRVVKNLGDSFLCLFVAATDGLRAALEVQHLVSSGGGISIRLSMTTGDVEEIDGDAFGECVNLSARILSKTPAGEIWFGQGTMVCMNAAEIPWESVGHFRLKGIPGDQEIYRAVPTHKAWLPDSVAAAVKVGNLVRIRRGSRPPMLPPDPVVMLEGFTPGSPALEAAVDSLPVLNPASLWLSAYNIAQNDRNRWIGSGRGLVIGTPDAVDTAIQDALKQVSRSSGSDTIVLDIGHAADLELVMGGLALPAVPLSDVVAGYSYDLLPDGRWVNRSDRSILRIDVDVHGIRIQALSPGVSVNGRSLSTGESSKLEHGAQVQTPTGQHRFVHAGNYAGLILSDTEMRLGVATGQTAELGREPNHPGLAFPDRRGQENIRWCSGPRAARARAGGFTLDRALAGRRQAAIEIVGDRIQLRPLHPRCHTYVLRHQTGALDRAEGAIEVTLDDVIVAGTTIVSLRNPA
jgi:hypothetical protein